MTLYIGVLLNFVNLFQLLLKSDSNWHFTHSSELILNITCEVFIGVKHFQENVEENDDTFSRSVGGFMIIKWKGRNIPGLLNYAYIF
jgi:hypothetical protein